MSVIKGLQAIQEVLGDESDRPKAKWLKVNDGQTVKIWFLQELDEGSKYFNEKAGTVIFVPEHTNPANYRIKCMCSAGDEGSCLGCERYRAGGKGWKAKVRMYANVLVEESPGAEKYVAVMNQGMGPKAITQGLIEFANENGGITQFPFKLKRKGAMQETSWTISPVIGGEGVDSEDYDLYDLEEVVVYKIPYDEQEAFFDRDAQPKAEAAATTASHDEIW